MPNIDRILDRGGGVAVVLLIGALAHAGALSTPAPLMDERVFVGAARAVEAGRSPYEHPVYNYPPPLAHAAAALLRAVGEGALLRTARAANLTAAAILCWFAAGFAVTDRRRRLLLACALVAGLPILRGALAWGNLVPISASLALIGWAAGRQRPLLGSALVGTSVALKPSALIGALWISALRLRERPASRWIPGDTVGWALAAGLLVAPWWAELAALARRMLEPPVFSPRNLSLRRALGGFGIDPPAAAIALLVLAAALALCRGRQLDDGARIHAAGVVSLLALPIVWSYSFLFALPLQVEAGARWLRRRPARRGQSGARITIERFGVPLSLVAIQGSAAAGVEFAAPGPFLSLVVLVPILAPLALFAYLRSTAPAEAGRRGG